MNIVPQLADEDSKDVAVKLSAENDLDEMVKETVRELNARNSVTRNVIRWRAHVTLGVLLLANLLNYIDRYTLAGSVSFSLPCSYSHRQTQMHTWFCTVVQ